LLPPNSRFKVMSNVDAGNGLTIINLKELPPLEPILDFNTGLFVSSFFQSSSQAAPVDPTPSPQTSEDALFDSAYKEALKSSGRPFPFTQLCLVGEGRAGKTALANSLCGRSFVQTDSTIGVCLERMQVSYDDIEVSAAGGWRAVTEEVLPTSSTCLSRRTFAVLPMLHPLCLRPPAHA
jgi:hypothetical protein